MTEFWADKEIPPPKKWGFLKLLAAFFAVMLLIWFVMEVIYPAVNPQGYAEYKAEQVAREAKRETEAEAERQAEIDRKAIEKAKAAADIKAGRHCVNDFDGSHPGLESLVLRSLKDPRSYEHIATKMSANQGGAHKILMQYRAKNSFNGYVVNEVRGTIDHESCELLSVDDS